jgi:hypothetical protein
MKFYFQTKNVIAVYIATRLFINYIEQLLNSITIQIT